MELHSKRHISNQCEYMTVLQLTRGLLRVVGHHLRDLYCLGTDQERDQLAEGTSVSEEDDDCNQTYTFTWAAMTGFVPMVMRDISRVMFANCKCVQIEAFFLTLNRFQRLKFMNPLKATMQIIRQNALQGDQILVVTVCLHRQQHTEAKCDGLVSTTRGYTVVVVPLWLPLKRYPPSETDASLITMTGRAFDIRMDHLQYSSPARGPLLLSVITIFFCLQYLCGDHDCDYTYSVTRGATTGAVKLDLMSHGDQYAGGREHTMVDGAFLIKHSERHETMNRVNWGALNVAVYISCKWCQRWRNITHLCVGDTWRGSLVPCRYCDTMTMLPRTIKIMPRGVHDFLI